MSHMLFIIQIQNTEIFSSHFDRNKCREELLASCWNVGSHKIKLVRILVIIVMSDPYLYESIENVFILYIFMHFHD
jgi:hypothetical protein